MPRVLVIEDEKVIRSAIRRLLTRHGMSVTEAGSLEEAEDSTALADHDIILADLRLPGAEGIEAVRRAAEVPVIIMTSYASVRSAVEAMREGAVDYIAKPFDNDDLLLTVERALKETRLERQNEALRADVAAEYPVSGIVGDSEAMQAVFRRIGKVAPTDTTVLILGESGTGKELVARALHERSTRKEAALVAVNCAAIPESLIEAELFGHEKGAFTGAEGRRRGLVESADGGTLFLDEIGELPLAAQARLLRVLQEGEIRRVGSDRSSRVDIRLVAATHRDLEAMVADGTFREDLYFRIQVMEIRLPPLRERSEDIPALARFLLEKACRRLNRPPMRLSDDALGAIRNYQWPGNVRELENAIERAVILAESTALTADLLGLPVGGGGDAGAFPDMSLEGYFREFVLHHQDHLTETEIARRLGISRKALWERRQRLGIPRPAASGARTG
ncbi:sigma-54-dependent transcriptional regulator [Arhodomonas aquaeolei]|uniref:sigma-54-dependent transcriptional regulator n=1 Tax=Arhodomonas aquaeolei TaxID=2369 RepID=UPI00035E6EFF|nr:sigma-54 dependent transcriptional regulator [Arhodomonas aquaeolei]